MQFATAEHEQTVQEIIDALEEYGIGVTNETNESFILRQRKQYEVESFDSFLSSLQIRSKTCNFSDRCRDSLRWDQIVTGVKD